MQKLILVILLIGSLAVSSCKKSSSSPSIAGTWTFSNISGTYVQNTDTSDVSTTTYTYSSNTITATNVTAYYGTPTTSTTSISVTSESWVFNSDGTYTINEVYNAGGPTSITSASTGTWDYLSNGQANDGLLLNGQTSQVLGDILTSGSDIFNIKTIGSTLVLTITNSVTNNTGYNYTTDVTLTFTKS